MKITFRLLLLLFILILTSISYLSIVGIETDRFNSQISNKIKKVDEKLEIELKKIKLILDPFKLKLNIKTVGSKLKSKKKIIEIENIKTQISLSSFIDNQFLIENIEISTKPLEINNLISFLRSFQNTPELFVFDKIVKKGFLIADIRLEFDSNGKVKNNYTINGFVKDAKVNIFEKYNFQNLNLKFDYKKDNLLLSDIVVSLNDLRFFSEKISFKKNKDHYFVKGNVDNKRIDIDKNNYALFIRPFFSKVNAEKLSFSSNNLFSLKLSKKFQINDFVLDSKVLIDEFSIVNELDIKNFFPNIKENLNFSDHKLSIKYVKNQLLIDGKGNILLQDSNDVLTYSVNKKKDILKFKTSLKIDNNTLNINLLNYKVNNALIQFEGSTNKKKEIFVKYFSLKEKKNQLEINNLKLNKRKEIIELDRISLDYIDNENHKNQIKLYTIKNGYILNGSSFNANKLIDELLLNNKNSKFINIDSNIEINIDKVLLDNENDLFNLKGNLFFKDKEIIEAKLNGNFFKNKNLRFTINTDKGNKITTLYVDKAEPLVKRYKFIKGFEDGYLDFYSKKTNDQSKSTIKIYDFKLKELPLLTKILTLASLQGIADILSGEGIRFDEFEMNFQTRNNLLTIDEIYSIGPAISILMDGYVEKNKLVSLRGTLVPATTINKVIGSIPILGKILVGKKTGEGVFGVSFKIKGSPKNLETTVNPIKTLTPRFVTRTLEKIKNY
jgi:hypothetical protein